MDEQEEARVRLVYDEHANTDTIAEGSYMYSALVLKALRELGLTPGEAVLNELIESADGVIDYPRFRKFYLVLKENTVTEEQIVNAIKVFDTDGQGFLDREELTTALTSFGERLTDAEVAALFSAAHSTMGRNGKIEIGEFAQFLLKRHEEATVPTHANLNPDAPDPEPQEVSHAKAQITSLRNLRHDEGSQRRAGFPSRINDISEMAQNWFGGSHIEFLSYDGPGDGADRLMELSDAMNEVDPAHARKVGFYSVTFKRADYRTMAVNMSLSHEDFTVADVKRMISECMSVCINNIVFTLTHGATTCFISGHPLERGGGSFLSQLFATYTQMTGDDNPSDLEVVVHRQPDIIQVKEVKEAVPVTDTLLTSALAGPSVTVCRVLGGTGAHSKEGTAIVFSDRVENPGWSRNPPERIEVTATVAKCPVKTKTLVALKVDCTSSVSKSFPFRCGVVINTASWNRPTDGQPLALYQWRPDGPNAWSGFSCRSTPVVMEVKDNKVQRILVEIHNAGLYYISDACVELVVDEGNLDGRINKKYEVDGKPKVTSGRPYIRPWGWTRKGLQGKGKADTAPAITYHGSELELSEWMFAPRKKRQKKISSDRSAGRTVERVREEWRPPGLEATDWEQWSDGGKVWDTLFFSPSLQFCVHRSFFQYYSLLLSCDVKDFSTSVDTVDWVSIPPRPDGAPIVRMSVMCYNDTQHIVDVEHAFKNCVPTVDAGFKGQVTIESRVPSSRCRPVGLLLKLFPEPPERRLRTLVSQWMDNPMDFKLEAGSRVMVRDRIEDEWIEGVVEGVAKSPGGNMKVARVSCEQSSPRTYSYIHPDFDKLMMSPHVKTGTTMPLSLSSQSPAASASPHAEQQDDTLVSLDQAAAEPVEAALSDGPTRKPREPEVSASMAQSALAASAAPPPDPQDSQHSGGQAANPEGTEADPAPAVDTAPDALPASAPDAPKQAKPEDGKGGCKCCLVM